MGVIQMLRGLIVEDGSPLTSIDKWGVSLGCAAICGHLIADTHIHNGWLPLWLRITVIAVLMVSGLAAVPLLILSGTRQRHGVGDCAAGDSKARRTWRSLVRASRPGLLISSAGLVVVWTVLIVDTVRLASAVGSLLR